MCWLARAYVRRVSPRAVRKSRNCLHQQLSAALASHNGQESESASQTPRWHLKRNQLGTPMWPHTAPLSRRLWRSPPARCVFLLDTLVSQAQVRCQRRAGAWTWQGSVPPPRSMSASCAYPRRFEVWGCWIRRTICHADVRCECPHIRACGGTLDACLTYAPSFWSRT